MTSTVIPGSNPGGPTYLGLWRSGRTQEHAVLASTSGTLNN